MRATRKGLDMLLAVIIFLIVVGVVAHYVSKGAGILAIVVALVLGAQFIKQSYPEPIVGTITLAVLYLSAIALLFVVRLMFFNMRKVRNL